MTTATRRLSLVKPRPVVTFRVTVAGKVLKPGDKVADFRGDVLVFDRVIRGPLESEWRSCKLGFKNYPGQLNHQCFDATVEELHDGKLVASSACGGAIAKN